jgi:hypothetical protein
VMLIYFSALTCSKPIKPASTCKNIVFAFGIERSPSSLSTNCLTRRRRSNSLPKIPQHLRRRRNLLAVVPVLTSPVPGTRLALSPPLRHLQAYRHRVHLKRWPRDIRRRPSAPSWVWESRVKSLSVLSMPRMATWISRPLCCSDVSRPMSLL